MILKTEVEYYVQVLYGCQWEDFQYVFDLIEGKKIIETLKSNNPDKLVRIVKRTTTDELI